MSIGLLDVVIRIGLLTATAFLFGLVFLAYVNLRNRRLLFISVGFGIFFAHALLTLPELFYGSAYIIEENVHLLIHFVALAFILVGTLKD